MRRCAPRVGWVDDRVKCLRRENPVDHGANQREAMVPHRRVPVVVNPPAAASRFISVQRSGFVRRRLAQCVDIGDARDEFLRSL